MENSNFEILDESSPNTVTFFPQLIGNCDIDLKSLISEATPLATQFFKRSYKIGQSISIAGRLKLGRM